MFDRAGTLTLAVVGGVFLCLGPLTVDASGRTDQSVFGSAPRYNYPLAYDNRRAPAPRPVIGENQR